MQEFIVWLAIGFSVFYLARTLIKSTRSKKQGSCSGCGKE